MAKRKAVYQLIIRAFAHLAVLAAMCALFALPFCGVIHAQEGQKTKVRVGYFDYAGFIEKHGQRFSGYGVSYLDEISKYAGLEYEYVFDSWGNLNKRLESGDIDLLCTMQYTPERAKRFDFCTVPSGLESGSLCVRQDSNVLFDDYSAFNGMKIGLLQNSFQNAKFEEYAKTNNFEYQAIYYQYMADIEADLASGKLDALVEGGLRKNRHTRTVANFTIDPFYFVTTKGNSQLLNALNSAMNKIHSSDPSFGTNLYNKWYKDTVVNEIVFTRREKEFADSHHVLSVALIGGDADAFAAGEQETLHDILQLISKNSGMKFEYLQVQSFDEAAEMAVEGKVDIVSDVYNSKEFADENSLILSREYDANPFIFIGKRGMQAPVTGVFDVAVSQGVYASRLFMEENYPTYNIHSYKNQGECINALMNGEVDMLVQKYDKAMHTLQENKSAHLALISATRKPYSVCLGVSKKMQGELISILDKSIDAINPSDLDFIAASNNAMKTDFTLLAFWQHNSQAIMLAFIVIIAAGFAVSTTIKRRHTMELTKLAYTDTLTGGDNVAGFSLNADRLLKASGANYAVLTIDINKFKAINNMYGYETGDHILLYIYNILKNKIQPSELLCHDVADRFVLLLQNSSPDLLRGRLEEMMKLVSGYSNEKENNFALKLILSCGICPIDVYSPPITQYIDHAYMAAKSIKNAHSSTMAVYDNAMLETLSHEKELEDMMDGAICNNEFLLYLQPKIHLPSYTVAGSEALVRWQLADNTMMQPDSFIPLFEKNGFIETVDFYMLTRVCENLREKLDLHMPCLPISVNQSRFLFYKKDYLENVFEIIDKYQIPPELLEFEITETVFLEHNESFVGILEALRERGIRISLDDFGTGYSSLNMLRNIPLDIIKIDREFLRVADASDKSRILIRKIVELAKALDMRVVCEGVETAEQARFLQDIGCDYAQGYYFSQPLPKESFDDFASGFNM